MNVVALINAKAGRALRSAVVDAAYLREAFQVNGIRADVRVLPARQLADAARQTLMLPMDALVVGGGDGTISTVAGILAGTQIPLGILPMGTLNHFARDLGIPLKLEDAIKVLAGGAIRQVDVAQVNGRVFVNDCSIGIPRTMHESGTRQEHFFYGKWLATLWALLTSLRRFSVVRVRVDCGDDSILRATPFAFIGNNGYEMDLFSIRGRTRLNAGQLSLDMANRTGRFGMLFLALRALVGRLEPTRDLESMRVRELWVETARPRLHVAIDGDLEVLNPPLHFSIQPRLLRVIAPGPSSAST